MNRNVFWLKTFLLKLLKTLKNCIPQYISTDNVYYFYFLWIKLNILIMVKMYWIIIRFLLIFYKDCIAVKNVMYNFVLRIFHNLWQIHADGPHLDRE